MDQVREVDPELRVEERRLEGARTVDDDEHGRRQEVGVAGATGGFQVVVQRVVEARCKGVLADLLATHSVGGGRVALADLLPWHRHSSGSLADRSSVAHAAAAMRTGH
jgi:hypothetical protein